jgi:hypothetical protein
MVGAQVLPSHSTHCPNIINKKGWRNILMEKVFRIKNKRWTIRFADAGDEHLLMGGEPCIAQLYKQLRIIYFDSELLNDYAEFRETMIHELVHAFIMTHAISHKQFKDEEFICEFIAVYGDDILKLADELLEDLYPEENED